MGEIEIRRATVEDGEVIFDLATDEEMPPWSAAPGGRTVLVEGG